MSEMNEKIAQRILDVLWDGQTLSYALEEAGVTRAAEREWRKTHPEYAKKFWEAWDEIRSEIVEDGFYANAAGGNVSAQLAFLKHRSARWSDNGEGGTGGTSISITEIVVVKDYGDKKKDDAGT